MPTTGPTPEQIKTFRTEHGLSQVAFAEKVMATRRTVEDWEAGRRAAPAMLHLVMRFLSHRQFLEGNLQLMREGHLRVRSGDQDITAQEIERSEMLLNEYRRLMGEAPEGPA